MDSNIPQPPGSQAEEPVQELQIIAKNLLEIVGDNYVQTNQSYEQLLTCLEKISSFTEDEAILEAFWNNPQIELVARNVDRMALGRHINSIVTAENILVPMQDTDIQKIILSRINNKSRTIITAIELIASNRPPYRKDRALLGAQILKTVTSLGEIDRNYIIKATFQKRTKKVLTYRELIDINARNDIILERYEEGDLLEYDLEDLAQHIDEININSLMMNQLGQNCGYNYRYGVWKMIETGGSNITVNMALALKLSIEAVRQDLSVEILLDQIYRKQQEIEIDFKFLHEGAQLLVGELGEDSQLLHMVTTNLGLSQTELVDKLKEVLLTCTTIRQVEQVSFNLNLRGKNGQQFFLPFPTTIASTRGLLSSLPPSNMLSHIIDMFKSTYAMFPGLIRLAGKVAQQKGGSMNNIFYSYNQLNSDYNDLEKLILASLSWDLEQYVSIPGRIMTDEIAVRADTLQLLADELKENNPDLYKERWRNVMAVVAKFKELSMTLNSIKNSINLRQGSEPEPIDVYDILEQIKSNGGRAPNNVLLKTASRIRNNTQGD